MTAGSPNGLIAEFAKAEELAAAAKAARAAGYTRMDAFSPFPLRAVNEALGFRASGLPYVPFAAAVLGGAVQYLSQYWMNVVDYPINVGGRPLHSWPAFLPSTLIVAILWAGVATFVIMLVLMRLPRLHHPVFAVPGFERTSQDRFFLWIMAEDPRFDPDRTALFLVSTGPQAVREVPG
jgi:Protein of unknown function (DUF3341)